MKRLVRKTKRLTLRPLEISDYAAWKFAHTSMFPQKNKWDLKNKSQNDVKRSEFCHILRDQKRLRADGKFYDLAVFENKSGKMIGRLSIMDVIRGVSHTSFLGYVIHNPFWRKGYGKEAVRALIDIAFCDLKLHRIEAGIEPTNRRSLLLARSLGLRREGIKRRMVFLRGRWNDLVMYSATCEEFGFKWTGAVQVRRR